MEVKSEDLMLVLYFNQNCAVKWKWIKPLDVPPQKKGECPCPKEWTFKAWDAVERVEEDFCYSGIMWCGPYGRSPPTHLRLTYGTPPPAPAG